VETPDPREALGVNTGAELAEAARLLRRRRNEAVMAGGASLQDPDTIHIGLDVTVEPDATILPFTILEGKTAVAAGARVGPYARLVDARVGAGAQILDHCLLRECVVEAGPGGALRPHPTREPHRPRAKVGNSGSSEDDQARGSGPAPLHIGDATVGPANDGPDHHLQLRRHVGDPTHRGRGLKATPPGGRL
jgi:bifunctional UDP-N-acetylglucosamine pyrophosphorylase/glucosamine-1-phosphate N-acetyltransferase